MIRSLHSLLIAAALVALPVAAMAEMERHTTEFDIRFGALPVGAAQFRISFDDKGYVLNATGKTVGVANLFAPGKGQVDSDGALADGRVIPAHNVVRLKEKKKKSMLEMAFADGAVAEVALTPDKPKKKRGRKWVPILPEQLQSVIDPASGVIVPVAADRASDPRAVCDRTLNIYDGDTRYDIALKYKFTKPVETDGYKGYAFVCQLRYIPVSGHKRKQRNIEYMTDNEDMEIWLAPMARTNVFSPIRIEVPTWLGKVTAMSSYFGASRE